MAKVYDDITQTVGNTPLVRINRLAKGCGATVLAKCEFFNPLASVKDRIGLAMVEAAERDGTLKPGMTVVEPTSGNTGIALAMIGAAKGYRVKLCMPACVSTERQHILEAFGAEVVLTPARERTDGAIRLAHRLLDGLHGEAGVLRLHRRGGAGAQADDHIDTGVLQVVGMGMPLGAVANDGDLHVLDQ